MSRSRLATAGIVLVALLAFPSMSFASFMDFIYEMSGPELISLVPVRCELDLVKHKTVCHVFHWKVAGEATFERPSFWIDFDGAGYLSTGKDSPTGQYSWGTSDMLAFDPMLRKRSFSRIYHSVGVSTNFFFGSEFRRFGAVALKIEPVAVGLTQNWYAVLSFRRYRHSFTAEQFDAPPLPQPGKSKVEHVVIGLKVEYRLP